MNILRQKYEDKIEMQKKELRTRQQELNEKFVWSPEHVAAIVNLNNKGLEKWRKAYDEVARLKAEYEECIKSGKANYCGFSVEADVWYCHDEDSDNDEESIWEKILDCNDHEGCGWGPGIFYSSDQPPKALGSFESVMIIDDKSWNEPPFHAPELDGVYIYYFMHCMFSHGFYSLEDALSMNAENFVYKINVTFDYF